MKSSLLLRPLPLLAAIIAFSVSSCTKSELNSTSTPASNDKQSSQSLHALSADEYTTTATDSGTYVIKYRPGPNNGQDVYTDVIGGTPSGNQNYVPELPVNVWNWAGGVKTRSFLRFPLISSFPDSLTIVSAKLYLFPPKDFLNHPQGNTGENECVIQRVLRGWTDDGLTWSNQPREVSDEDEAFIPATTDQWSYSPVIDITAMVKKMVSGEVPNYGFRISLVTERPDAAVNFASSEAVDGWRRPTLIVEYK